MKMYDAHKMVTTVKRGREGGKYDSEKCDTENGKKKIQKQERNFLFRP